MRFDFLTGSSFGLRNKNIYLNASNRNLCTRSDIQIENIRWIVNISTGIEK